MCEGDDVMTDEAGVAWGERGDHHEASQLRRERRLIPMNYQGSYRRLLANSKSAIVAGIELYNKPNIEYRDEIVAVLIINGWELFLKAMVSKSGNSIYYPKKRGEPYRTLSLTDAFRKASGGRRWPSKLSSEAVGRNLDFLATFRDNAIHFYNAVGFSTIVYLLAQTAIRNYQDMLVAVFGQNLKEKINWQLMPLGIEAPVDPIVYLAGKRPGKARNNKAVDEFLRSLSEATAELEEAGIDAGRLMTIYDVSLNSVRKLESADIVVGVESGSGEGPLLVQRRIDPNQSHPFRQVDAIRKLAAEGLAITQHQFQAIVFKKGLRSDARYCWIEESSGTVKWSSEILKVLRQLTPAEMADAVKTYNEHQRLKQARTRG